FDLVVGADPPGAGLASWSPGNGATLTATRLELSNQAPATTDSCPSIPDGHVWFDLRGTFGYAPSGLDALDGDGCLDLATGTFKVQTKAEGTLLRGGSTFTLTGVALSATGSAAAGTFRVTA